MKHNTHIYLAVKAIEFARDAVDNLRTASGRKVSAKTRRRVKDRARELQRLLRYYAEDVREASWAPDDIVCDKALYHTFKLFTDDDFPGCERYARETHVRHGKSYHRISGGGGLPYKVDHLARTIADMQKLRSYNDLCRNYVVLARASFTTSAAPVLPGSRPSQLRLRRR